MLMSLQVKDEHDTKRDNHDKSQKISTPSKRASTIHMTMEQHKNWEDDVYQ
jgi:hypothetical protein